MKCMTSIKYRVLSTKYVLGFLSFLFILNSYFLILNTNVVIAQTSSNDNYQIDLQEIDINPQNTSGTIPSIVKTEIKKEVPKEETEYIVDNSFLSIYLDNNSIDFGTLSPGNPVTRTVVLSIKTNSGYAVQVSEDHSPQNQNNSSIPDTTCEDGQCSETIESLWKNNLTYGFGMRCDPVRMDKSLGSLACMSFEDDYYKQVANISRGKKAKSIISGKENYQEKKAKITFKLNAPGTQKPGSYSSNITLIAVPNY